jgi:hypothetical protein
LFHPGIAEALGGGRRWFVPPTGRETGGREFFDQRLVEFDGENEIANAERLPSSHGHLMHKGGRIPPFLGI